MIVNMDVEFWTVWWPPTFQMKGAPHEAVVIMELLGSLIDKQQKFRVPKRLPVKVRKSSSTNNCRGENTSFSSSSLGNNVHGFTHYITWLAVTGFSADVENLSSQNEAELRRQFEERQQETQHVYELLENKIQLLQEVSGGSKEPGPLSSFPTALPAACSFPSLLCFPHSPSVPVL